MNTLSLPYVLRQPGVRLAALLSLSSLSSFLFLLKLNKLSSLNGQGLVGTLLGVFLFAFYSRFLSDDTGRYRGENLFSGMVAVFFLFGDACVIDHSLSPIWSSAGQLFKSVGLLLCYFVLLRTLTRVIHAFLDKRSVTLTLPKAFASHPFLFFGGLILLFWLPQILIKFPGTMCYDIDTQLGQYFGYLEASSNHPMTHTLFLGWCWEFGMLFHSPNLGLFTAVILQALLMAGVFSYTLVQMYRMKVPRWVMLIAFAVYAVTPNITGYVTIPLKDIPYSTFYVLYTSMLVDLLWDEESFWQSKRRVAALILSGAMVVLLRNNGLLAIIPISLWLGVRLLRSPQTLGRRLKRVAALAMTFVITLSVNTAIDRIYQPVSGSMGEPLSFFMQQTARTLRDHPHDVTDQEAAAIDRVLDYEAIGSLYNPRVADPVKATWKQEATVSDVMAYLGAWAKQGLRHPLTYFEATVSQNYSLFYPQVNNIQYYPSVRTHNELDTQMPQLTGLHGIPAFDSLREGMTSYYTFLHNFPFLGMLSNIGFWVLVLLLLRLLSRHHKVKGMGLITLPALLTLFMCIASPVILLQSRYAFPLVYSMPVILAAYVFFRHRQAESTVDFPSVETVSEPPVITAS